MLQSVLWECSCTAPGDFTINNYATIVYITVLLVLFWLATHPKLVRSVYARACLEVCESRL